jgi:hypothetical protein
MPAYAGTPQRPESRHITRPFCTALIAALRRKPKDIDGKAKITGLLAGFKVELRWTNDSDGSKRGDDQGYVKLTVLNSPTAREKGLVELKKGQYVLLTEETLSAALQNLVTVLAEQCEKLHAQAANPAYLAFQTTLLAACEEPAASA